MFLHIETRLKPTENRKSSNNNSLQYSVSMHRNKYKTGQIIGSIGGLGKNERKGEQTAPFSRYFAFGRIGVFGNCFANWIIHRFLSSCRRVCRRVFRLLLLLQMLNQKKVAARRGWRNSALFVIRRRGWLVASCRRYRQLSGLLLWRLSCGAAKISKGLQKGGTVIFGFAFCFGWGGDWVGVSERSERGEGVANALSL